MDNVSRGVPEDWAETVRKWEAGFQAKVKDARFSEVSESYLNKILDESLPDVKRYAIGKLAGVFYDCIVWNGNGSRAEADWLFAEESIEKHVTNPGLKGFAHKGIILNAYETIPHDKLITISGNDNCPGNDFNAIDLLRN